MVVFSTPGFFFKNRFKRLILKGKSVFSDRVPANWPKFAPRYTEKRKNRQRPIRGPKFFFLFSFFFVFCSFFVRFFVHFFSLTSSTNTGYISHFSKGENFFAVKNLFFFSVFLFFNPFYGLNPETRKKANIFLWPKNLFFSVFFFLWFAP